MKKLLLLSLALLTFFGGFAQGPLWKEVAAQRLADAPKVDRTSFPTDFRFYNLNLDALRTRLQDAPSRDLQQSSNVIVQFPNVNGELRTFRMFEASVMDPELAARYPQIQSYVGQGIENPAEAVYVSSTIFGLHVMMHTADGTVYIDPYTKDLLNYMVYARKGLTTTQVRQCLVKDEPVETLAQRAPEASSLIGDGVFRTYRLAMACTIEYAAFHITAAGIPAIAPLATKKAAVLAAMVVTMTRVNGVYERDMSLRMNLIANNDALIFVTSDNFDNNTAGTLIAQSQTVIDATVGFANYDIGHTVSTGGGGLATLNSPCSSVKARGITGSGAPVGDPFDIDYVAHEMGHQYGATHTFNNSCGGNRTNATAYEPGSGVTIMAYAGICDPNVQSNSDDHFHAASIAQMTAFVQGGGTCSVNVSNGNSAPVANAGANYTIPNGTPFILTGSATDANGDTLTYCWEQMDNQISTQPPLPGNTSGPNVTSDSPKSTPVRYIPSFDQVLAGNLAPTWEVIPTVGRTMNFALTVRDNRTPNGGQTGRDDMTVTFANSGPFAVTSPAVDNVSWPVGSTQTITWSLGGSTAAPINTTTVNIMISTDNGATFSTLVANTANDGTETITVPNTPAPFCRIMIVPVGNIYYALSKSIAIGYTIETQCNTYNSTSAISIPDGTAANVGGPIASGTISVPAGANISDVNVTIAGTHSYFWDLIVKLKHPDGTEVRTLNRNCNNTSTEFNITFNDGSPAIVCSGNVTGTYAAADPLSNFNGKPQGGTWTLTAQDFYNGDTGTINSWSVTICALTGVPLSNAEFGLDGFVVYPNPSNGSFNVKFDAASSNPVNLEVHDMRGRQVFANEYANSGSFDQNITLNNVQAGVYILTVSTGERKEVKRIVVN